MLIVSCQCGVSRSATLVIAYIMSLAVAGLLPDQLGHLRGMQDAYAMVKAKSSSIGPNVSYVPLIVFPISSDNQARLSIGGIWS
jgi:predicted protein tyrosine phosphatase